MRRVVGVRELILNVSLACAALSVAAFASLVFETEGQERELTGQEIEALIQRLVSPNKAPDTEYPEAKYPNGYDHAAQKVVREAWLKLYRLEPAAFSHLRKYVDDKRYSFTEDAGFHEENWTVGRACKDVINCHLMPHGTRPFALGEGDPRSRPRRPVYYFHYKPEWWESRRGKPLRDLQIEVVMWVIAQEAERPADFTPEETSYLNGVLAKIRESKEALKPAPLPFAR